MIRCVNFVLFIEARSASTKPQTFGLQDGWSIRLDTSLTRETLSVLGVLVFLGVQKNLIVQTDVPEMRRREAEGFGVQCRLSDDPEA